MRGCGTWIEQLFLDYGPNGTQWLVTSTTDGGLIYDRFFGDKHKAIATEYLKKCGQDNPLFFIDERPEDFIFPNDHINYISDHLKDEWYQRAKNRNFSEPLCLKTLAQQSPKCSNCGGCETPEEKKFMLTREIKDEHSFDEVMELLSENHHKESIRIIVKTKPGWELVSKDMLTHIIASKFLQCDETLVDKFYAVGKNTTTWASSNNQKCWYGGTFAFDVELRERVSTQKFKAVIPQVNEMLKSVEVIDVVGETKALPIKVGANVTYLGTTTEYTRTQMEDRLQNFNWDIKKAVKAMSLGLETETVHMPELKKNILFVPKGNALLVYMTLPSAYNPYLVMSSITGKGYNKMLEDFKFNIMDNSIEVDASCKCGNHLSLSYFTGKTDKVCPTCKGKYLLAKMTGKVK